MRIAVVGAGAVGGYFGGRLAKAGNDVHFIARGAHLTAMSGHGLRVRSVRGDFAIPSDQLVVTDDPRDVGPCDFVLFTVKSFDTLEAAGSLSPLLGSHSAVISFQNGVGNEELIAAKIGAEHVVGGVALIFARIEKPGVIRDSGGPARLVVGELDGRPHERLDRFQVACAAAGIESVVAPNIWTALWTKFAFICAQAGLTAATRLPLGAIRDSQPAWDLFRRVVEETYEVGRALHIALPETLVDDQMTLAGSLPAEGRSSLYDDLAAGRRIELEALLGDLVRKADTVGLSVPAARTLYAVLEPWSRLSHSRQSASTGQSRPSTH